MAETLTSTVVNLGSVSKVPLGQGRAFIVRGQEIAVFRQRDGRLFATQSRCPHKGGPLADGIIGAGKLFCPLHAHKYDMQSGAGPHAHECLTTYSIEEVDGAMLLDLPDAVAQPAAACAAS